MRDAVNESRCEIIQPYPKRQCAHIAAVWSSVCTNARLTGLPRRLFCGCHGLCYAAKRRLYGSCRCAADHAALLTAHRATQALSQGRICGNQSEDGDT